MDVGLLRAELELDATQFRRDVDQAGNQFRALAQEADRAAQTAASAFNRAGQRAAQASGGVESAWQQAGSQAEAAASGIQGAWSQAGSRAEAAASGIGGEWRQAGSQAESAASGIGGAFQQAGSQAESAASGIGGAFETAGAQGEQAASGIGDAFSSAMEGASGAAEGSGASGGGAFIASFGTRIAALGSKAGPIGLALGATVGIGALAGAKLADTVYDGFAIQAERDFAQASFGLTDTQMSTWGEAAGNAYGNAWGESVNANLNTAGIALQAGLIDGDATAAEVQPLIEQLSFVSSIMGEEIPAVARAAGQMIKTGMVDSPTEAFDLLTLAQQRGLNMSEDLLDTMVEYGTQFRKVGIDGQTAMGLISQLMEGGARDTDIAADAIKEFSLRSIDGSEATTEAFETLSSTIGSSAEEIQTELGKGGDAAFGMTDKILDALGEIEDPIKRNELSIALFGTQVEDLGGAFDTLDLSTAAAGFDATGKAIDGMNVAGGGAAASIEAARNKISVAADEVKVKLAEAFAPMAADAGTWVTENQDEILNFFIELAKVAITVTAAVLDGGGAMMQFGSMAYNAGLSILDGFISPLLTMMETLGGVAKHIPGMGWLGDAMESTAQKTRSVVAGMKDGAEGMDKVGGAMFTLADKIRSGTATLEDYQAAQREASGTTGEQTEITQGLIDTLNALPREKPIDVSTPGGTEALDLLTQMGVKVTTDNNKNIVVESPLAPQVLELLRQLGIEVVNNNGKDILVTSNAPAVKTDVDNLNASLGAMPTQKTIQMTYNFAQTGQVPGSYDSSGRAVNPGTAGINVPLPPGVRRAAGGPISGPGGPKSDDVPIWASNGEFMQQTAAVDFYGLDFMHAVNERRFPRLAFADGGPIGYGLPAGSSGGFPDWVNELGNQHGVTPSTYAGHQEGNRNEPGYAPNPEGLNRGIDWGGSVDSMQGFAEYLLSIAPSTPALEQIIWMNPQTGQQIGWYGRTQDDGSYYASDYAGHQDHVHTRQSGPLTGVPAGMDVQPAEIEVPVLSTDSSKEEVARAIIAQGRKRGYTDEEIKAILATGMQESGLSPTASGGGGAWQGVFQQDSSYEGRNDPNQNIAGFYDRLDEKHKGDAGGDIWEDIFWLQQRPGDTSGASAVANGRQGYMTEIQSQSDDAGALFDQVAPSVGTMPAPGDPGMGAPAGVQQVYVVGGRLDGAPAATTPAVTSTPSASAPAAAAPPEVFGRGPLPIVAYANGGTIPGVGNEDSELLLGMPGEEIIRKGPAEEWRPILKAINSGKLRRFAAGGTVGFGGYSDDTSDAMAPNNWYDWLSLAVGGGFAAASIAAPYVNMAMGQKVSLGDLAPTVNTSANSVDGIASALSEQATAIQKQIEELTKAVRESGKTLHVVPGNQGAASMLQMTKGL